MKKPQLVEENNVRFLTLFFSVIILAAEASAQTAMPILGISPSAYLNGMGGAGAALMTTDPFVIFSNPAQVAANFSRNGVSAHFYPVKTSLLSDRTADLRASAMAVGYRIPLRMNESGFRIGLGYITTDLDLGTHTVRDPEGNPVAQSIASENYYGFSLSFAFEYKLILGFGLTYKWVSSERGQILHPDGSLGRLRDDLGVFDYGFIAVLPVYGIIFEPARSFQPFLNVSAGYAKTNIGDDVTYNGELEPLPLPKTGRIGFAANAGIRTKTRDYELTLISADWTTERLHPRSLSEPLSARQDPLTDIDNQFHMAEKITGFDVKLLETLTYQQGSYSGADIEDHTSRGIGIGSGGLFILLRPKYTRNFISFIFEQVEVTYYQSWYHASTDLQSIFRGVNIRVGGF